MLFTLPSLSVSPQHLAPLRHFCFFSLTVFCVICDCFFIYKNRKNSRISPPTRRFTTEEAVRCQEAVKSAVFLFPTCSLKSVEKYRPLLLCLSETRGQRRPAECSNHDAIRQTWTTLIGSTADLKGVKETHAKLRYAHNNQ